MYVIIHVLPVIILLAPVSKQEAPVSKQEAPTPHQEAPTTTNNEIETDTCIYHTNTGGHDGKISVVLFTWIL